jgi:hypothetical protein
LNAHYLVRRIEVLGLKQWWGAQIGDKAVSLKANDAFSLAGLEVRVRCAVVVEHGCWT